MVCPYPNTAWLLSPVRWNGRWTWKRKPRCPGLPASALRLSIRTCPTRWRREVPTAWRRHGPSHQVSLLVSASNTIRTETKRNMVGRNDPVVGHTAKRKGRRNRPTRTWPPLRTLQGEKAARHTMRRGRFTPTRTVDTLRPWRDTCTCTRRSVRASSRNSRRPT